jgi:hypothetical protein
MKHHVVYIVGLLVLLLPRIVCSQRVANLTVTKSETETSKTIYLINYDLVAVVDNIACRVRVEFSSGGNSFYLKQVKGDVGDLIYPGKNKKIEWDYVEELIHFSGDLNLSLEVTPVIFVESSTKRGLGISGSMLAGGEYPSAKSGLAHLVRNRKSITSIGEVSASDLFSITIPKNVKPSRFYQLSFTRDGGTIYSNVFKIRRRVARLVYALPVLIAPAYLLLKKDEEKLDQLPGPPGTD